MSHVSKKEQKFRRLQVLAPSVAMPSFKLSCLKISLNKNLSVSSSFECYKVATDILAKLSFLLIRKKRGKNAQNKIKFKSAVEVIICLQKKQFSWNSKQKWNMNTNWDLLQNSQNSEKTLLHLHEELSRRNPYKSELILAPTVSMQFY